MTLFDGVTVAIEVDLIARFRLCVIGVLLMGEPVHWEKSLQIITDILLTNGEPNKLHQNVSASQIPVVAVNTDYLWMSEAPNARCVYSQYFPIYIF